MDAESLMDGKMEGAMMMLVLAVGCIVLALSGLILEKTYFYLPPKELKRQAAQGDEQAHRLFQAATYGTDLKLLLWFVTGLSAGLGFVLLAHAVPVVISVIAVALTLWLGFVWLPRTRLTMLSVRLAVGCTPVVVWLLRLIHPIARYLNRYLSGHAIGGHTRLYERGDMAELLERQSHQPDNRMSEAELGRLRQALQFGDYRVRDVVVPRKRVTAVRVDDSLGPVLLDELHASGHHCFPVYDGKKTNLVGVLVLDDVADTRHQGKVSEHYQRRLAYIHESDSLDQALQVLYTTRQQLLIVVDDLNSYIGIVSLGDVLHRLAGVIHDPGDNIHGDRAAVVARHRQIEPLGPSRQDASENVTEVLQ